MQTFEFPLVLLLWLSCLTPRWCFSNTFLVNRRCPSTDDHTSSSTAAVPLSRHYCLIILQRSTTWTLSRLIIWLFWWIVKIQACVCGGEERTHSWWGRWLKHERRELLPAAKPRGLILVLSQMLETCSSRGQMWRIIHRLVLPEHLPWLKPEWGKMDVLAISSALRKGHVQEGLVVGSDEDRREQTRSVWWINNVLRQKQWCWHRDT